MDKDLSFAEYYWDYRNRVISDIVLFTILRIVLQIIGMLGNVSIAVATIQHKHFRGTCGILLAAAAISDSLHQLSHYYFGYLTLSGINFTSLKTCVIINTVPLIGLSSGMFDAQPGYTGLLWFDICLVFNVLTIFCYIIVWIGLKINAAEISGQKMIRSLSAITAVVFLGWAMNAGVNVVANFFNLTLVQAWYVGFYVGIMINIAVSSNYFVLFIFSKEYRTAFMKQLNSIAFSISGKKIVKNSTRVRPASQNLGTSERARTPSSRNF
ncbi:hypothetical protein FO519_002765 [Halicephalobus sp. NKZ332]|nr:hypothetical protein FO519_002765 [Halicephalobus sp. NKZ332]